MTIVNLLLFCWVFCFCQPIFFWTFTVFCADSIRLAQIHRTERKFLLFSGDKARILAFFFTIPSRGSDKHGKSKHQISQAICTASNCSASCSGRSSAYRLSSIGELPLFVPKPQRPSASIPSASSHSNIIYMGVYPIFQLHVIRSDSKLCGKKSRPMLQGTGTWVIHLSLLKKSCICWGIRKSTRQGEKLKTHTHEVLPTDKASRFPFFFALLLPQRKRRISQSLLAKQQASQFSILLAGKRCVLGCTQHLAVTTWKFPMLFLSAMTEGFTWNNLSAKIKHQGLTNSATNKEEVM